MNDLADLSALIDEFLDDAAGHIEAVELAVMTLEKLWGEGSGDSSLVTRLLGNLHTLKGNSGMMGFSAIQQFVHKLESVFKLVQESAVPMSAELFEILYSSINALRSGLATVAENPAGIPDFSDELMALEFLPDQLSAPLDTSEAARDVPIQQINRSEDSGYIIQKSNTLKVSFEKLDELLNLVGELVIHRTSLEALEKKLKEKTNDRELLEAFSAASQSIGKSSTELREAIMKARMLPIKSVFQRFQRLVRDHSNRFGKEIRLQFEGEETELDKTVIDEIGEPLLHLIRNACDHGIESPAARRRAGKPPAGTITLGAGHENNHIVISVRDDGLGMDAGKIKRAAVARNIIGAAEAENLSREEILQLVFSPGFSTSSELTETSGRGIGLDVVKKIVTSLNGMIEIDSRPGEGAAFTIKLPLTLAIITALMVEVSGETYAIPLSGVFESIRISRSEIHDAGGKEIINLRDQLITIYRLNSFFGLHPVAKSDEEYIVIVGSGVKTGGLIVDRLIGQQEIVIKALDDYLGELSGISGGTVLGDGAIALIVDVASILTGV